MITIAATIAAAGTLGLLIAIAAISVDKLTRP